MSIVEHTLFRKMMEVGCRLASIINPIIPKSSRKVLFYESTPDYMNNYELMKYMVCNEFDQKYNIYYFPNIKKECKLDVNYDNVKFSNNLALAFWLFLTAKFVFLDTGNMRMIPSKKQCVIYMDHGLPFKLAGKLNKVFDKTFPKDLIMPVNYFLSSSAKFDSMYCEAYNIGPEQLIRCGRPRTDALYKKEICLDRIGIDKSKYSKIIMWMTTYRITNNGRTKDTTSENWSKTNLPILTDMEKIKQLNEYLKNQDMLLVIKIHASSVFDVKSIQEVSNVRLLMDKDFVDKGIQIYSLLKDFDVLITDYSSVFLDYVIVDKPIIFIVDDIEEFNKLHGFFFDNPLEFMPGPKVNTYDELVKELNELDYNEIDFHTNRMFVKDFCHYYQDGNDSKRILTLLGIEKQK